MLVAFFHRIIVYVHLLSKCAKAWRWSMGYRPKSNHDLNVGSGPLQWCGWSLSVEWHQKSVHVLAHILMIADFSMFIARSFLCREIDFSWLGLSIVFSAVSGYILCHFALFYAQLSGRYPSLFSISLNQSNRDLKSTPNNNSLFMQNSILKNMRRIQTVYEEVSCYVVVFASARNHPSRQFILSLTNNAH